MNIENLREEIDQIDNELIELLNKRYVLTDKIGKLKKELKIQEVEDKAREKKIYEKIVNQSPEYQVVQKVYQTIIQESKKRQE